MMFPVFTVSGSSEGSTTAVIGTVSRTKNGRETWVAERVIGFLKWDNQLILGRWCQKGELWEFSPEAPEDIEQILLHASWEIVDGYWGDRVAIVLDESRQWNKASLEATADLTHDHCDICWQTIGLEGDPGGYTSGQTRVCARCYTEFVMTRSLSFIPMPEL